MAAIIISKLDLIDDIKGEIAKYFRCQCCGRISNLKKIGIYYQCFDCPYRALSNDDKANIYYCWVAEIKRSFLETRMYINEVKNATTHFRYNIEANRGAIYVPLVIIKQKDKFLKMCDDYSFTVFDSKNFACVGFTYAEPLFSEYKQGYVKFVIEMFERLKENEKVRYYSFFRAAAIIISQGLIIGPNRPIP